MTKIITIPFLIAASLILFANGAQAAYVDAQTIIVDNNDALTKCTATCARVYARWTGSWWTTADPTSVCECLRDWPWCPVLTPPPPPFQCYLPPAPQAPPIVVENVYVK